MKEIEKQIINIMYDYASQHGMRLTIRCDRAGRTDLVGEVITYRQSLVWGMCSDTFRKYMDERGIRLG